MPMMKKRNKQRNKGDLEDEFHVFSHLDILLCASVSYLCVLQYTTFVCFSILPLCASVYYLCVLQYNTFVCFSILPLCASVYYLCVLQYTTFVCFSILPLCASVRYSRHAWSLLGANIGLNHNLGSLRSCQCGF